MTNTETLRPHSYWHPIIPPLLIVVLAQTLFEIISEPSMVGITTVMEKLSHQIPESENLWILEETRGRYTWLTMSLLSIVTFVYGAIASGQIVWNSAFRQRLPLLFSLGAILLMIGPIGLMLQFHFESAMYRLIFGFTFSTFSHSNRFDPALLANIKTILLLINALAATVPAIIVLAAGSTLVIPRGTWQPTLDSVSTQMHQLRHTLNIGSIVIVAGVLHMHAWLQWPASLMQDPAVESTVSGTALAITMYWGTCFTLMLMAAYGPAAIKLSGQARHLLKQQKNQQGAVEDPQTWLKEHDLSITLGEQLPQIGIMLAPVLAGPIGSLVMGSN